MKPSELSFDTNVKYNSELEPSIWDGWEMNPAIRERLLDIAQLFVDYLDVNDFDAEDIVLTGSLVNFNYTQYSDFDLHIVTDYDALGCDDIAAALYDAKKRLWNDKHDITINGFDVELYVEDSSEPPESKGYFSVQDNKWIKKPDYVPPKYDKSAVIKKAQHFIDEIQVVIRTADETADYERMLDKIYKFRKAGLSSKGEFSTENLVFKVLRNQKWIDRLRKAMDAFTDRQMSI
jgi:predicted nucleotidyltransferase